MSIKTRVGNLVHVKNENKKKAANNEYYAVVLKNGSTYSSYLFTEVEIAVAFERGRKNPEDQAKRNFLSTILD
jgi:hypothetical protein